MKKLYIITMLAFIGLSVNAQITVKTSANGSIKPFPEQIISKTIIFNPAKAKLNNINNVNNISTTLLEGIGIEFIHTIEQQIRSGKIKIFKEYNDTVPMSINKFFKELNSVWDSTAFGEDPNNPGSMVSAPMKFTMLDAISEIRFIEDWKYDINTGNIIKKVIAYSLIATTDNDTLLPPRLRNLNLYFWIKNL